MENNMFMERFEEERVKEKGKLRLLERVKGKKKKVIKWMRKKKVLKNYDKVDKKFDGEKEVMEIRNEDYEVDDGDYKCLDRNKVGKEYKGERVIVDVDKVKLKKKMKKIVEVEEKKELSIE
jgi:hypothetical protein